MDEEITNAINVLEMKITQLEKRIKVLESKGHVQSKNLYSQYLKEVLP